MTNPTLLLPQYHKYLNGAPVPFSRRTRRNGELCLVLLVFVSLTIICFGAVFYLPEFKANYGGTINDVYKRIQNAGPELLLPAAPHGNGRHDGVLEDPHAAWDKKVLSAKIDEDYSDKKKVLERPDTDVAVKRQTDGGGTSDHGAKHQQSFLERSETARNNNSAELKYRQNFVKAVSVLYWFSLNGLPAWEGALSKGVGL